MKSASEWRRELAGVEIPDNVLVEMGRKGDPTLKVEGIYFHSRYEPREEARRLIEDADLPSEVPILVVGLGLGYHVLELLEGGAAVVAYEPDPAVARLALEGPLRDVEFELAVGGADQLSKTASLAGRHPTLLLHPPTMRRYPGVENEVRTALAKAALAKEVLNIAVVGPMFGGSLPIAEYLERGFRGLGHRTMLVRNEEGWPLHELMRASVKSRRGSNQLTQLLTRFMGEWTYARVAEFEPEICIVMAQAPVDADFPSRMRKSGVTTAFWFVENWRHMDYWRSIARDYDYFFHIQPGEFEKKLDELGCRRHAFVQTGCDPEIHRPVELNDEERPLYECDVSFAGAGYPNRNQLLAGLTDYDLKIWGVNWHGRDLQRCVQRAEQRFTADDFARIVAGSKINLNLHSSVRSPGVDPECDAVNPRVFEIAACGGFQLCDPCSGLDAFFDLDKEIPAYRDLRELRARIDYYLAHEEDREAAASAARDRALREHTYQHRAQEMLDHILAAHGGQILERGVRAQRTTAQIAEMVGEDSELGAFLTQFPSDTPFLQEELSEALRLPSGDAAGPEAIFLYLREMRRHIEGLLDARDYAPGA